MSEFHTVMRIVWLLVSDALGWLCDQALNLAKWHSDRIGR